MTTEQTTDDTADQLAEAQHARLMSEAELDALRPAALRENIRLAGYDPDGSAGKVLAELAATDSTLRTSTQALRAKGAALGLEAGQTDVTTVPGRADTGLNDPNFPPDHPRNTPGNVAYRIAARERSRREKSRQLYANITNTDAAGNPRSQAAQTSRQVELAAAKPPVEKTADKSDPAAARHAKNRILFDRMTNKPSD